jgi:hypothetical protein
MGETTSKLNQRESTASKSGPTKVRSKRAGRSKPVEHPLFEPNAAGIDIGAREIFVAVPPDRDTDPVRKCETFTEICIRWRPGWSAVASPRRRWNPLVCIGLDSDVGRAGATRHQTVSGESAEHEERAGKARRFS